MEAGNLKESGGFHPGEHDHERCVAGALTAAAALCRGRGARLTPLRQRVLELVWGRHGPVGAYAVLDALRAEGRSAAPPTVYRALDFLVGQGLVHRIESLNAFVGCPTPERPHTGQFLICDRCGTVAEQRDLTVVDALARSCAGVGFAPRQAMIEIHGACPGCRNDDG